MTRQSARIARRLSVTVTDARGRPVRETGLARWLERAAPARARGGVSIALVSDAAMRRLNTTYRGQDRVTDVLSFPAVGERPERSPVFGRPAAVPKGLRFPARAAWLGDLAIARGVAARQARQYGHPLGVELRVLALHGLLHLLGYDHETDSGTMRRLEERLRRRVRLPTGLVTRAGLGRASSRTAR